MSILNAHGIPSTTLALTFPFFVLFLGTPFCSIWPNSEFHVFFFGFPLRQKEVHENRCFSWFSSQSTSGITSCFFIESSAERESFVLKVEFCIHCNGPHGKCLLEASQARFPKLDQWPRLHLDVNSERSWDCYNNAALNFPLLGCFALHSVLLNLAK